MEMRSEQRKQNKSKKIKTRYLFRFQLRREEKSRNKYLDKETIFGRGVDCRDEERKRRERRRRKTPEWPRQKRKLK